MTNHTFNTQIARELGGSIESAILLQYIHFWIDKNTANKQEMHNGKIWVYHTHEAFCKVFDYISKDKIARILRNLEKDGYIETSRNIEANLRNRVKYYTLTDKYFNLLAKAQQEAANNVTLKNAQTSTGQECKANALESSNDKIANEPMHKSGTHKALQKMQTSQQETQDAKMNHQDAKMNHQDAKMNHQDAKMNLAYNDISYSTNNITSTRVIKKVIKKESISQKRKSLLNIQDYFKKLDKDNPLPNDYKAAFECLWLIYPRKVAKNTALKAYKKRHSEFKLIQQSIKEHIATQWRNNLAQGKLEFIPHFATFLNQERYKDTLENENLLATTSTATQANDSLKEQAKAMEKAQAKQEGREYDPSNAQRIFATLKSQQESNGGLKLDKQGSNANTTQEARAKALDSSYETMHTMQSKNAHPHPQTPSARAGDINPTNAQRGIF